MISRNIASWQQTLALAYTDPRELLGDLELTADQVALQPGPLRFPFRVPRGFAARMGKGDPGDPLLRQVIPRVEETRDTPGFRNDPVGDRDAIREPGLLHKYDGRVLLVTTGACAVHCRYCFRQHFPYADSNPLKGHWERALAYIAADPAIEEIILSGGDPLTLSDERLTALTGALCALPQIKRLRIHSRLPVVLPERVDDGLLRWLGAIPAHTVMVIHANHANEIDASVRDALAKIKCAGVTLLNQSVLLRGVNDDAVALRHLSNTLFDAGVLPYYLHLLDRVAGTAHFDVPEVTARALIAALQHTLPGYLVPRLVREVPGAPSKVSLLS
jgi:EF-P beta-lysylation protein EpmB